ncbi:MAG: hypothetical protein ABW218_01030, partial [Casimicrobiaceae bacterium]
MTPSQIEQVFGRERLKMTTGDHVEVFREAMASGERRRYTKRFLATRDGDFGPWTEREWRILARLIGHGIRCVPDVVQFDGGALGGVRLVQTYDAGVTVDQWSTLLPVARDGDVRRHVFEDCAHWWALAYHCLAALDEIHALGLVHLDIKGDNICIPYGPADFDPDASGAMLHPAFARLALIDFAFSVVSRESLAMALPIGWQKDYDYQSPRLLRALDAGRNGDLDPTKELDWRCDLYSLAAMLRRYLPDGGVHRYDRATSWTPKRYDDARTLIFRLRDSHDRDLAQWRPHGEFMEYAAARMEDDELAASLAAGWTFARDASAAEAAATPMTPITPMTRVAPAVVRTRATHVAPMVVAGPAPAAPPVVERPVPVIVATVAARLGATGRIDAAQSCARTAVTAVAPDVPPIALLATRRERRFGVRRAALLTAAAASIAGVATPLFVGDGRYPGTTLLREFAATLRESLSVAATKRADPPSVPEDARAEGPATQPDTPTPAPAATQASPTDSEGESQNAGDASATSPDGESPPASSSAPANATASARAEDAALTTATAMDGSLSDAATKEPRVPPQDAAQAPPSSNAKTRGAVAAGGASASAARGRTAASRPPAAKRSPVAAAKASPPTAKNYVDATRRAGAQPSSAERSRAQAATTRLALATMSQPPTAQAPNGTTANAPAPGIATSNIATSSSPTSSTLAASTPPSGKISGARNAVTASPPSTPAVVAPVAGSAMASSDHRDESVDDARSAQAAELAANAVDAVDPAALQSDMQTVPPRGAPRERSRNDWRAKLNGFFGIFRERHGPAAPVEERNTRSMAATRTQVEPRSVGPAPVAAPPAIVPLPIEPVVATPPRAPAEAPASSTMAAEPPPSAVAIAPASQNLPRIPAPPAALPARTGTRE